MKIHAVKITENGVRTLREIAEHLHSQSFEDRNAPESDVRLEDANFGGREHIFLDFAKRRHGHGPGRMGRNRPLQEFEMEADDTFGEDSALVFHEPSGYAAVQYNHHGPRIRSICEYLTAIDLGLGVRGGFGFSAAQVLKPDAYDRLHHLDIFKEISFAIVAPGAMERDLRLGRSVGQILDAPMPGGTQLISVSLRAAAGRDSTLARDDVMNVVRDLRLMGENVKRAVVKGKREDRQSDQIDLVEEFLTAEVDVQPGRGQRYARNERWMALERTLRTWLRDNDLPRGPVQAI